MSRVRVQRVASLVIASVLGLAWAGCGPASDDSEAGAFGAMSRRGGKFIRAAQPVKGQYIVVMAERPGSNKAMAAAQTMTALASVHRASVKQTFRHAIVGFTARMSEANARALSQDPAVAYVEQDGIVRTTAVQSDPPWGLDRIDQADLPLDKQYRQGQDGRGVTVYVIDSGIRITHQEFEGRASHGFSVIDDGHGADDCAGHGTHVAGTIASRAWGVAKGAKVVAVRVLSCWGSGTWSGVIAGIDWVTANAEKPAVANMSLGGQRSQALNDAIQRSTAAGVLYAVSAGNDYGNACYKSPASAPGALTVGATDSSDYRASFSNMGRCVDLFAPGESVLSASNESDTASATHSGTSMASPHAAGVAALWLQTHRSASPAETTEALKKYALKDKLKGIGIYSPNELLFSAFQANCHINAGAREGAVHASRHTGLPYTLEKCKADADKWHGEGYLACGNTIPAGEIVYQELVWGDQLVYAKTCPACVPKPEITNGIDDDCDGEIDEGDCPSGQIYLDACGCVSSAPINCHINAGARPGVVHSSRHTGKPYTFEECQAEAEEFFTGTGSSWLSSYFACGKSIPAGPIVYQEVVWGKCRYYTNNCP